MAGGYCLTMNRSLVGKILWQLSKDPNERWNVFQQALKFLQMGMPLTSALEMPEPKKLALLQMYVPQVLTLRTHSQWPDPGVALPVSFAETLADLATHMWHAGLVADGICALHTAIDIMRNKKVSKDRPLQTDVYAKFGTLLSLNGISDRSKSFHFRKKAYDLRHKKFDLKDPNEITTNDRIRLYNIKCDMAWHYVHSGQLATGEALLESCLEEYRKRGTEDELPFEYARYFIMMAFVRIRKGMVDIAVTFSKRGAALMETTAGVEHPMTQTWRFLLGVVMFHAGALQKSFDIHDGVLQVRKTMLGEFNRFTLESYSTCGALLLRLGRNQEAKLVHPFYKLVQGLTSSRELLVTCLERRKRLVWYREGVARAQHRLSKAYEALGKKDESKVIAQQATETKEQILKEFSDDLKDDADEEVVFDQMVSFFDGRFTTDW